MDPSWVILIGFQPCGGLSDFAGPSIELVYDIK